MSDVFGLTSDESVDVQKKKARYEKLCYASKRTAAQRKEMKRLEEELAVAPPSVRSNVPMARDHLALLQTIHNELKGRKS